MVGYSQGQNSGFHSSSWIHNLQFNLNCEDEATQVFLQIAWNQVYPQLVFLIDVLGEEEFLICN